MNSYGYRLYLALMVSLTLLCGHSFAQQTNKASSVVSQPQTPAGFVKGTPALGSYGGSNFDQVNLFNGNVSITLPLASLVGRDGMRAAAVLSYNSKIWHIQKLQTNNNKAEGFFYDPVVDEYDPDMAQIAPGWTLHTGKLRVRYAAEGASASGDTGCTPPNSNPPRPIRTLTTITFTAPDGTEHDFIDVKTDGKPQQYPNPTPEPGKTPCDLISRGTTFRAVDGSAATFVSDTEIFDNQFIKSGVVDGTVYLKDGSQFIVVGGCVIQEINPNGNVITYRHTKDNLGSPTTNNIYQISDTQGNVIDITYNPNPNVFLQVTWRGVGGAVRGVTVNRSDLISSQRDGNLAAGYTIKQLFNTPKVNLTTGDGEFNPRVVSSITLPSGHSWEFKYNIYGEVTSIKTPTNGNIDYEYGPSIGAGGGMNDNLEQIFRRVIARKSYPQGRTNLMEGMTTYSDPNDGQGAGKVTEQHIDNANKVLATTLHTYVGTPQTSASFPLQDLTEYPDWKISKEIQTQEIDPARGPLKQTTFDYHQQEKRAYLPNVAFDDQPQTNPHLTDTETTLLDTNEVTATKYTYDPYSNVTDEKVFDFGVGSRGVLLRETSRSYVTSSNYVDAPTNNNGGSNQPAHIRGLVASQTVKNGTNQIETTSTYVYDGGSLAGSDAGVPGRAPNYAASHSRRGNVTQMTAGANNPDDQTTMTMSYDVFGNVVAVDGPLPNQHTRTTYEGGQGLFFTYPTQSEQDVTGGNDGNRTLTSRSTFDPFTGAVLATTGFNGETISYQYNDLLDRLTRETRPPGFGFTTYAYSAPNTPTTVTVESQLDNRMVSAINEFDGLLRTTKQRRNDPDGEVSSEPTYDGLGRVSTVTNPHRGNAADTDGLTTTTYDGLSRVLSVNTRGTEGDTGTVRTQYFGRNVTVTDQAGKQRRSLTDGLGRLSQVIEPNATGALSQNTDYDYDARGNLLQVNQGAQTRTFTYDTLSRLKTATAPESGTLNYSYDKASNLKTRTDARGITTTYNYDSLNRLVTKNYSDATPAVAYFYDRTPLGLPAGASLPSSYSPGFALGRLTGVATPTTARQMATATFFSYDIGGRTTKSDQLTQGQHYPTSVDNYNNLSLPTSMTYPSGKVLEHSYNDSGQLLSVTRDGQAITDSVSYTATGGVLQQHLGNGLYHSMAYNSRLQPIIIALGTGATGFDSSDKLRLEYDYDHYDALSVKNATTNTLVGIAGQNNGNIGHIRIFPGLRSDNPSGDGGGGSAIAKTDHHHIKDKGKGKGSQGTYNVTLADLNAPFEQYYGYDELNRLAAAKEFGLPFVGDTQTTPPSVTSFTPDFSYPGDNVTVNITGINLAGTQGVSVSPSTGGLSASVGSVSETSVSLNVNIPANATPGQYQFTLLNPLGETGIFLNVLCVQITLTDGSGQPPPFSGSAASPVFSFSNLTNGVGPARLAQATGTATFTLTNRTNSTLIAGLEWRTIATTEPNTGALITFALSSNARFISNGSFNPFNDFLVVNTDGNGVTIGNGDGIAKNRHDNYGENSIRCILKPQATELLTVTFTTTNVFPRDGVPNVSHGVTQSIGFASIFTSCVDIGPQPSAPLVKGDGISPLADAQPTILWHEDYDYDRYGNRTNLTLPGSFGQITPIPIDATNNRLNLPTIKYDAAGNITNDGQGNSFEYDAENHMIKASNSGGVQGAYFYDGQGKRVQKARFNETPETTFVYGIGGSLWAEYATTQPEALTPDKEYVYGVSGLTAIADSSNNLKYLTPDHLGSNRIVTDRNGTVVARYDFLPFGADMGALGSRTGITGYVNSSDQTRQHFTGYERDTETGLDFAQARYFGSMQGRFLSPDPITGDLINPQTWNRYAYVKNNPLKFNDPNGLFSQDPTKSVDEETQEIQNENKNIAKFNKIASIFSFFVPGILPNIPDIADNVIRQESEHPIGTDGIILHPEAGLETDIQTQMIIGGAMTLGLPSTTLITSSSGSSPTAPVNIDTGAAISVVSEQSSVRGVIKAAVGNNEMVMTQTARSEFTNIVGKSGGPLEQARAQSFLNKVTPIADNPSARALGLNLTKKVGANDKIIFGTADRLGIRTITTDAKFVRGASSQGVNFNTTVIAPPAPLTGK